MNLNNHSSRRTGYDYNKSTYPFKLVPDHVERRFGALALWSLALWRFGALAAERRVGGQKAVDEEAGQGAERGVVGLLGQGERDRNGAGSREKREIRVPESLSRPRPGFGLKLLLSVLLHTPWRERLG